MKLDVNGMAEWRRRKLLCHTWAKRRWAGLLNRGRREHGMQEVVCTHLVRKSAGVAIFRKTPAAGGGKDKKRRRLSLSVFFWSLPKKTTCCCSYNTTTSCRNSCRRRVRRYIWCVLVARPAKDALHRLAAAAREETNVGRWNNVCFPLPHPHSLCSQASPCCYLTMQRTCTMLRRCEYASTAQPFGQMDGMS